MLFFFIYSSVFLFNMNINFFWLISINSIFLFINAFYLLLLMIIFFINNNSFLLVIASITFLFINNSDFLFFITNNFYLFINGNIILFIITDNTFLLINKKRLFNNAYIIITFFLTLFIKNSVFCLFLLIMFFY